MNVGELLGMLRKFPPEMEVWTAIDAEGNGYNEMYYEPTVMVTPLDSKYSTDQMYNDEPGELEDCGLDPDEIKRVLVL
jgi:hypothetical protein